MSRSKFQGWPAIAAIILTFCIFLSGCAGPQALYRDGAGQASAVKPPPPDAVKNPWVASQMKALGTVGDSYNALWKTFVDLRRANLITLEQWNRGKDEARKFYSAYQKAVDMLEKVEKGESAAESGKPLIDALNLAADEVKAYLAGEIARAQAQGGKK